MQQVTGLHTRAVIFSFLSWTVAGRLSVTGLHTDVILCWTLNSQFCPFSWFIMWMQRLWVTANPEITDCCGLYLRQQLVVLWESDRENLCVIILSVIDAFMKDNKGLFCAAHQGICVASHTFKLALEVSWLLKLTIKK